MLKYRYEIKGWLINTAAAAAVLGVAFLAIYQTVTDQDKIAHQFSKACADVGGTAVHNGRQLECIK